MCKFRWKECEPFGQIIHSPKFVNLQRNMIYIASPTLPTHVKRQVMSVRCMECKSFDLTHKVNIFSISYVRIVHRELILSKENRENCIMKLKTVKTVRLYGREPTRKAAVLVPLCTVNNELSFYIHYSLQI
jgi:hypothetical protein